MKAIIIFIFFLFLNYTSSCQIDTVKHFQLNQFNVSCNRSSGSVQGEFGYGLGLFLNGFNHREVHLRFGLEYNRISLFQEYLHTGHISSFENVTYHLDYFSIPLLVQIDLLSNNKLFLEAGLFIDIPISGRANGIQYDGLANEYSEVNKKVYMVAKGGFSFGVAYKFPLSKYSIIINPDIKVLFNPQSSDDSFYLSHYLRLAIGFQWHR